MDIFFHNTKTFGIKEAHTFFLHTQTTKKSGQLFISSQGEYSGLPASKERRQKTSSGDVTMKESPEYPLTVLFHEERKEWILNDDVDAAVNLEWFDSKDPEERATVTDNKGRAVHLVVRELVVTVCELACPSGRRRR